MKDLIKQALDNYMAKVLKQVPATKKYEKTINLDSHEVTPLKLVEFMKQHNIPDHAEFGTDYDECSISNGVSPILYWDIDVPTTEKDRTEFIKRRFNLTHFKFVYDLMKKHGYKRIGANSFEFKKYKDTTVYDMYMTKDWDRLEEWFKIFFRK